MNKKQNATLNNTRRMVEDIEEEEARQDSSVPVIDNKKT